MQVLTKSILGARQCAGELGGIVEVGTACWKLVYRVDHPAALVGIRLVQEHRRTKMGVNSDSIIQAAL